MLCCLLRLLPAFIAVLATTLTPLASTAEVVTRSSDCGEHTTHQAHHCSDCIAGARGLNCVLPLTAALLPGARVVVARLEWPDLVGETRADPPPLPPPRAAARA